MKLYFYLISLAAISIILIYNIILMSNGMKKYKINSEAVGIILY